MQRHLLAYYKVAKQRDDAPLKWDHFEILAKGRSDTHCEIKETLLIQELKPTLNDAVSSEKLYLYQLFSLLLLISYLFLNLNLVATRIINGHF